jgi:putative ABC transport system ATP-binding protein
VIIEMSDIRKGYPVGPVTIDILRGVELAVPSGQLVAIEGTSGCGKSTLMNLLGFLDVPDSGSYRFNGKTTADMSDRQLSDIRNREIGFVFQHFHLLPRLTALDNVALPLVYRGLSERERRRICRKMLDRVGMGDRANHRPSELSGGQQQRVAIARALAQEPALILADEPTGALDSQVGQDIMDLFLELNRKEGITVIIITHDPRIAAQCDRICGMKDGVLKEKKPA